MGHHIEEKAMKECRVVDLESEEHLLLLVRAFRTRGLWLALSMVEADLYRDFGAWTWDM